MSEIDKQRDTLTEARRLFGLNDRWLAQALLQIARGWRAAYPDKLGNAASPAYNSYFTWQIMPELAKRLGAKQLLPGEAANESLAQLTDAEMRVYVGQHIRCHTLDWLGCYGGVELSPSLKVLYNEIANGNPVAFALDRIHPALDTADDWTAKHMRDLTRHWGLEPTPYWSPDLIQPGTDENFQP